MSITISDSDYRDLVKAKQERDRLAEAIRLHRSQIADDRCFLDDDLLYEALGDGVKCDRRVGNKQAMLLNCMKFLNQRCESGYWPTYQELKDLLLSIEPGDCPFCIVEMENDSLVHSPDCRIRQLFPES